MTDNTFPLGPVLARVRGALMETINDPDSGLDAFFRSEQALLATHEALDGLCDARIAQHCASGSAIPVLEMEPVRREAYSLVQDGKLFSLHGKIEEAVLLDQLAQQVIEEYQRLGLDPGDTHWSRVDANHIERDLLPDWAEVCVRNTVAQIVSEFEAGQLDQTTPNARLRQGLGRL